MNSCAGDTLTGLVEIRDLQCPLGLVYVMWPGEQSLKGRHGQSRHPQRDSLVEYRFHV
jgi:hypothetical protein